MLHLKLEAINKQMVAQDSPKARFDILLGGLAKRIKDELRNNNYQELNAFADSLDRDKAAIYAAYTAETEGKTHGAGK